MVHHVTLVPGDGIGPEVMDAACRVVEATGVKVEWDVQQVGPPAMDQGRPPLPDEVLESVRRTGVALKGPVSTPAGKKGFRSVNVGLRRELGLFGQVRPCRSRPGTVAPFEDVDLCVIRETTEDLYAGVEFPAGSEGAAHVIGEAERDGRGTIPPTAGLSIKFTTEAASRRVLEFAFDYARRQERTKVTAVHKATVMRCTDGIFLEVAGEVAKSYPELEFETLQIDNLCGQLVRRPAAFDVLVMGIHYGDIVSDLAAGLVGGIGVVPGVNYGTEGVMFEPAHGTLPRLAGADQADPTATVLCAAMLLEHLGEVEAATRVNRAVDRVIAEGEWVTYDLRRADDPRPPASTTQMADAMIDALDSPGRGQGRP
ncbi:MAG: isocitrate/isopropylmalate dehydrogenase family protein [Acidimicrobiales bacterium]|nr:isocitrate/isopropylmalate dehydrogenase family protein [Acidimicrobiales bacterium]